MQLAGALGIAAPRIAVAGLNPHAGENGLLATRKARNHAGSAGGARRGLQVSDPTTGHGISEDGEG